MKTKKRDIKMLTQKVVKLLGKQQDLYHYNYYIGTVKYIIKNLEQEKRNKLSKTQEHKTNA